MPPPRTEAVKRRVEMGMLISTITPLGKMVPAIIISFDGWAKYRAVPKGRGNAIIDGICHY